MVWRREGRKIARKRRRKPWNATWESSEKLEVGWGKGEPVKLEMRGRLHSFRVWEHKTELVELPWPLVLEEQEGMGVDL